MVTKDSFVGLQPISGAFNAGILIAIATKKTKDDIATSLGMLDPKIIKLNLDRLNIFFSPAEGPVAQYR